MKKINSLLLNPERALDVITNYILSYEGDRIYLIDNWFEYVVSGRIPEGNHPYCECKGISCLNDIINEDFLMDEKEGKILIGDELKNITDVIEELHSEGKFKDILSNLIFKNT